MHHYWLSMMSLLVKIQLSSLAAGAFFLVPWGSWTQHSRLVGLNFQSIWKRNIKLAEFSLLVVIFISEAQLISAVNTAISLSEKKCLTSILASPTVDKGSRELTLIEFLACCLLVLHICLIFFFYYVFYSLMLYFLSFLAVITNYMYLYPSMYPFC